ncbi:MAG: TonB-dependent receptor [Saprospiraceae bacterium]|nr:TonB-dependent receptor [Saprospiraceae bacterium]
MKYNRKASVFIFLLAFSHQILSQSVTIDTVFISATALEKQVLNFEKLDSPMMNAIDLAGFRSLSVQSNGPAGLTTISNRGMASRHTAVLYAGLPVNGATTGVYDIGLIPFQYFNACMLFQEGLNGQAGNHSLGGGLLLKPSFEHQNNVSASMRYTSAKDKQLNLSSSWSGRNWYLNSGYEWILKLNQFQFLNNGVKTVTESPQLEGFNANLDGHFFLPNSTSLKVSSWLQHFDRDVAAPYYRLNGQKQEDYNQRYVIEAKHFFAQQEAGIKLAFFNERILFTAPGINSSANTKVIIIEPTFVVAQRLFLKSTFKSELVNANFFQGNKNRETLSFSALRSWHLWGGITNILLAQQWTDGKIMPLVAEIRAQIQGWKISMIRNYNLPGFNDLYWPSGGNENLSMEKSLQFNGGYTWNTIPHLTLGGETYSYVIHNFIQWTPDGIGLWRPSNTRKVWSRGVEFKANFQKLWQKIRISFGMQYAFTKATILEDKYAASIGRQMIYIPEHKGSFEVNFYVLNLHLGATLLGMGRRYDSTDNFTSLDPYVTANGIFGFEKKFKFIDLFCRLEYVNFLDTDFAFVRSFPMPLHQLNYQMTLKYKL